MVDAKLNPKVSTKAFDVLIIGGGPVGMLLSCLLAEEGLGVGLVEKRNGVDLRSKAIGIMPPSLEILAKLKLDGEIIDEGISIKELVIHGSKSILGRVSLSSMIPLPYPFILSCPQSITMQILRNKVLSYPHIQLFSQTYYLNHQDVGDQVTTWCYQQPKLKVVELKSKLLIGADGSRSEVRSRLPIKVVKNHYQEHFIMGDFEDKTNFKTEAHLYFTPTGAVESFPLPGGIRRWIVQTHKKEIKALKQKHLQLLYRRIGLELDAVKSFSFNAFSPYTCLLDRIQVGNVILCGDAAHVISPIGGQGMNVGFGDVDGLVNVISHIFKRGSKPETLFKHYSQFRAKAVRISKNTSSISMWLGTRQGGLSNGLRGLMFRLGLKCPPLVNFLVGYFSMTKTASSKPPC